MEQRTDDWFAARLGKVTASRVADATARTKSGWGASRANYMAELVAERLTGTKVEGFTSAAMNRGTELEPEALAAYSFVQDIAVEPVGFVPHPAIAMAGASPDGLVGKEGLIEVKCPNTATHIETLLTGDIDLRYLKQMQFQIACTGRAWCDFVSYDPRMPERMQIYIQRVHRNAIGISEMEKDIQAFLSELDGKVSALRSKYDLAVAA